MTLKVILDDDGFRPSWAAWGTLMFASASASVNLCDKGIQLPASRSDVTVEVVHDEKETV